MPGCGACAELDDRNTIRPPAGIAGSAALATTNAEVRLVRSTDSNVSSDSLRTKVPAMTPAACTSRSTRPASATTAANASGSALSPAAQRAPMSVGGRLELVGGAGGEHHVVAALDEHPTDGQPDPAAAPGDDRYPRAAIHGEEPKR